MARVRVQLEPARTRRSEQLPLRTSQATVTVRAQSVRQWGNTCNAPVPGRSMTIVRLDNGEIPKRCSVVRLRTFRRSLTSTRVNDTPLDSPMSGHARCLSGRERWCSRSEESISVMRTGTIWRFDVSNVNPDHSGPIRIFYDMYNGGAARRRSPTMGERGRKRASESSMGNRSRSTPSSPPTPPGA